MGAALEAVPAGGTLEFNSAVELDAPLSITKDMTIDLNGQSVSSSADLFVVEGAKVTLKDSNWVAPILTSTTEMPVAEGEIVQSDTSVVVALNGAEVTIESGNYISNTNVAVWAGTSNAISGGSVIINDGYFLSQEFTAGALNEGSLTINGGIFGAKDNAVLAGNGSTGLGDTEMTINGGTFIGNIESSGYLACGIYHPQNGKLTVNGGTFYINNGVGILVRSGEVTINDVDITTTGSISGKVGDSKVLSGCYDVIVDFQSKYPGYADSKTIVNDGTFIANESVSAIAAIPAPDEDIAGKLVLNGGIYSSVPGTVFLGENKSVSDLGNGTYQVV